MTVTTLSRNGVYETARKIREIGNAAREVFVDREEAIHAFECGLCSGEHMIMLSKPGTSKSALCRFFAEAMGRVFYATVLNMDTVEEKLLGPIDLEKLQQGEWDRSWSGLAVADIVLADEVGNAPNFVLNMLLKAMEERKAETPDYEIDLPLHMLVAGTNQELDYDAAAVWDRFTIRLTLKYINKAEDFVSLLHTDVENIPDISIEREELKNLRDKAKVLSFHTSKEVDEALLKIWAEVSSITPDPVSDRRWKRLLKVAAGRAILFERDEIYPEDLVVGKWILWNSVEDEEKIRQWIEKHIYSDKQKLVEFSALVRELVEDAEDIDSMTKSQRIDLYFRCDQVITEAKKATTLKDEWKMLVDKVENIRERIAG